MSVTLNRAGEARARSLVKAGEVSDGAWSFDAADGDKLLGPDGDDWSAYAAMHLGVDTSAPEDTRERFKYPFGKGGKVYLAALRAARSRASQQGANEVFEAAGKLLAMAEPAEEKAEKERSLAPPVERRTFPIPAEFEARMADGPDGRPTIRGYAAVWDSPSQVMRTEKGRAFREYIRPGAFAKAIRGGADVRAMFNHNPAYLLGRMGNGTLRLEEDRNGLRYEIDPPDVDYAHNLVKLLQRRDVTGSSFSFATVRDEWGDGGEDGVLQRQLHEAHPFDVGPVVFPAYLATSAGHRCLPADDAACRSLERWLESRATFAPSERQLAAMKRFG